MELLSGDIWGAAAAVAGAAELSTENQRGFRLWYRYFVPDFAEQRYPGFRHGLFFRYDRDCPEGEPPDSV